MNPKTFKSFNEIALDRVKREKEVKKYESETKPATPQQLKSLVAFYNNRKNVA